MLASTLLRLSAGTPCRLATIASATGTLRLTFARTSPTLAAVRHVSVVATATRPTIDVEKAAMSATTDKKARAAKKTQTTSATKAKKSPAQKEKAAERKKLATAKAAERKKLATAKAAEKKAKAAEKKKLATAKVAEKKKLATAKAAEKKKLAKAKAAEKKKAASLAKKEKAKSKKTSAQKSKTPWLIYDEKGNALPMPLKSKPGRTNPRAEYLKERFAALRNDPAYQKTSTGRRRKGEPVLDATKVMRAVSAEWLALDKADRDRYEQIAADKQPEYERALKEWQDSLTPADIERQNRQIRVFRRGQTSYKKRSFIRDPTRPKRPVIGFFAYLASKAEREGSPKGSGLGNMKDKVKEAAREWGALASEEKAQYANEVAMEQYKKEYAEWKKTKELRS